MGEGVDDADANPKAIGMAPIHLFMNDHTFCIGASPLM
jgi:hypothetical protein